MLPVTMINNFVISQNSIIGFSILRISCSTPLMTSDPHQSFPFPPCGAANWLLLKPAGKPAVIIIYQNRSTARYPKSNSAEFYLTTLSRKQTELCQQILTDPLNIKHIFNRVVQKEMHPSSLSGWLCWKLSNRYFFKHDPSIYPWRQQIYIFSPETLQVLLKDPSVLDSRPKRTCNPPVNSGSPLRGKVQKHRGLSKKYPNKILKSPHRTPVNVKKSSSFNLNSSSAELYSN